MLNRRSFLFGAATGATCASGGFIAADINFFDAIEGSSRAPATQAGPLSAVLQERTLGNGLLRSVKSPGTVVVDFASGLWAASGGSLPLTQGYNGYDSSGVLTGIASRTGMPEMLLWAPVTNSVEEITLGSAGAAASKLRNTALGGQFVLAVYVANLPGYEAGGAGPNPTIGVSMTTDAGGATGNGLYVGFSSAQVREGWNFLKFAMRNPNAYKSGSGEAEYHPFGVNATGGGTGLASDIVNTAITTVKIDVRNCNGASLYFDSIWTGFDADAQVVLGADDADGADLVNLALPLFQARGWVGYVAVHGRYWNGTGNRVNADLTDALTNVLPCYAAGWDAVNHSMNHRAMSGYTAAQVAYEVQSLRGLLASRGLVRGGEFYASPLSSTSRVSEKVIKDLGFVAQRHARKLNISVTPWGVDNLHYLGGTNIGSATSGGVSATASGVNSSISGFQTFSKIKRMIDVIEAYKDTWMPFWHGITQAGDSGSGEDVTGDDLLISYSAFQKTLDYIAEREAAGGLKVRDGLTGWYYGVGR